MKTLNTHNLFELSLGASEEMEVVIDTLTQLMRQLGVTNTKDLLSAATTMKAIWEATGKNGSYVITPKQVAEVNSGLAELNASLKVHREWHSFGVEDIFTGAIAAIHASSVFAKRAEMAEMAEKLAEMTQNAPESAPIAQNAPGIAENMAETGEFDPFADLQVDWDARKAQVQVQTKEIVFKHKSAKTRAQALQEFTTLKREIGAWAEDASAPAWIPVLQRWIVQTEPVLKRDMPAKSAAPAPKPATTPSGKTCVCPQCKGTGVFTSQFNGLQSQCGLCAKKGHNPKAMPARLAEWWLSKHPEARAK